MAAKCIVIICSVLLSIFIYFPARHARHYQYITIDKVHRELVLPQMVYNKPNLKLCNYETMILNNTQIEIESIYETKEYYQPKTGGEYSPKKCHPLMKVALIVPYRSRAKQLRIFLNFMHNFLQDQELFYRIFIVNQADNLPFNRAKMLNYGAKVALDMNFDCLILHDVDLIPLNTGNIYSCTRKPRHMSSSLDTFRFNLPYLTLFGGAVAILSEQFKQINGMSNDFVGWGGEDDDFYNRLEIYDLLPYRFAPELSKYTMLIHKKERASPSRFSVLKSSSQRHRIDGLNSLSSNYSVKFKDLYTLIMAS